MMVDMDVGPYAMVVVAIFCAAIVTTANVCTDGLFRAEMAVVFVFNVGVPAIVVAIQVMGASANDIQYARVDGSLWAAVAGASAYAAAHVSIFGGCQRYYGYLALSALSFVLMTLTGIVMMAICLSTRLITTRTVPVPPPPPLPPAAPSRTRSPRRRVAK